MARAQDPHESDPPQSFAARLRQKYGEGVDPEVSLGGGGMEAPSGATSELLKRLSEHGLKSPRYKLEGEVARGGMGAILRVWDEDLRRHLAMKVVLGKGDSLGRVGTPGIDAKVLARFLEEAQVTSQLDHPGIVPVHELGLDAEGRVYFTMKLVKGRDLKHIFDLVFAQKEGWSETRALGVVLKVCEAMAYAHKRGVIHRDIKPANVMVGGFGEVFVMDWGLARVLGRKDTHDMRLKAEPSLSTSSVKTERREEREEEPDSPLVTMDGDVMGTPCYMSPEQARGEVEKVGPRSDVYSVGAVLYHLLARQMPFVPPGARVSTRSVLMRLLEGPPKPLLEIRKDVPAEIASICEKAMSRDARERYADTAEMAEDLLAFLESRVVRAHRTGALVELRKWVYRNRLAATTSASAILLALGGLGMAMIAQVNARNAAQALHQVYASSVLAADASLQGNDPFETKLRLKDCAESFRGWEWDHLGLRSDSSLSVLTGHTNMVRSVVSSPDGRLIASTGAHSPVRLWDARTATPLRELEAYGLDGYCVAFSADGSLLASGSDYRADRPDDLPLVIWDPSTGKRLHELSGHTKGLLALAFAPDGSTLASGADDDTIRLWNARSGESLGVLPGHTDFVCALAFSPDGSLLASGSGDRTIRIWNVQSHEFVREMKEHFDAVRSLAFDRSGKRLASGSTDRTVRIWDVGTGSPLAAIAAHEEAVRAVAFSPDDSILLSASLDKTVRLWDASSWDAVATLYGHDAGVRSSCFDAEGSSIVSASDDFTIRLWDVRASRSVDVLRVPEGVVYAVAWSPNGSLLACGSAQSVTRIWDATTWATVAVLRGLAPDRDCSALAFSPDGSRLVSSSGDGAVCIWTVPEGKVVSRLSGHEEGVRSIALSVDGSRIATVAESGMLRLWDGTKGEEIARQGSEALRFLSVAFDPSGSFVIATTRGGIAHRWDARTLRPLGAWEPDESIFRIAFSPDGTRLAHLDYAGSLTLSDVASQEVIHRVRAHHSEALCVAFSPNGRRILTASQDHTLRLWDTETLLNVAVLRGHTQWVRSAAFSPGGDRIASGSDDGTVRVWYTEPASRRAQVLRAAAAAPK